MPISKIRFILRMFIYNKSVGGQIYFCRVSVAAPRRKHICFFCLPRVFIRSFTCLLSLFAIINDSPSLLPTALSTTQHQSLKYLTYTTFPNQPILNLYNHVYPSSRQWRISSPTITGSPPIFEANSPPTTSCIALEETGIVRLETQHV